MTGARLFAAAAAVATLIGLAGPAAARGPNPAAALEAALDHWRAASWYVRIGDENVSAIEIDTFRDTWGAVAALGRRADDGWWFIQPTRVNVLHRV